MRVPNALLLAAVVGLLAGCAQHRTPVSAPVTTTVPSVAPHPSYAPISAAAVCPTMPPVHLPDDAGPVGSAYVCTQETRPVPGDGEWQFLVVKGVTSGLHTLLLTYRAPDAAPGTGTGTGTCDSVGVVPQALYLHGSRTLAVRAPLDGCGKPIRSATEALAALGTVEIAALKLNRVTSPLAQTSGCSDQYKDMLAVEEESGGPPQTSTVPSPVALGSELCIYTVTLDSHGYRFVWLNSARQLSRTEVDRINSALSGATVDASCSRRQHDRFALLQASGTSGGPATLVDLDGCAVQQDGGWWRATDRLRALIAP